MLGFRILKRQRAVNPDLVNQYKGIPVANVSDCMGRLFSIGARLRPMHAAGSSRMAGPAFTVRTRPGDNLLIHKALETAEPGDIIVVDGGGCTTNALIGEIMAAAAEMKGIAGFVINGAIRDAESIRNSSFPVFACGVTHRGPYKDGPGEINVTIAIDNMVIEPGDLIIGDEDGVLCVPCQHAESVYQDALEVTKLERNLVAGRTAGTYDTAWIDAKLTGLGFHIET